MNVKIDLSLDRQSKPKTSAAGLSKYVAVMLLLMFVFVSASTMVYGALKSHYMKSEIRSSENAISRLSIQNASLSNELKRLQQQEKIYTDVLDLLQNELPSVEFLSLLEENLPAGVWLNSVKMQGGSVSLTGNAYGENDVVLFARGLLDSELVKSVSFPDTRRGSNEGGMPVVDFGFTCQINDIVHISSQSSGGDK